MEHRTSRTQARFPGRRARAGALRELLPEGIAAWGRPVRLASPHDASAARRAGFRARSGSPRSTRTPPGPRATKATMPAGEVSAPDGAYIRIGELGAGARTRHGLDHWRRARARQLGPRVLAATPSRFATCPTSSCTRRSCRGRRCSARIPTPPSPGGSRSPARRSSSTAGQAWSATTGARSTPSAGPGSRPRIWAGAPATTSTSQRAESRSDRSPPPGSRTAGSCSTASRTRSAARQGRTEPRSTNPLTAAPSPFPART